MNQWRCQPMVISRGINRWETVEPVEVSTSGKQVVNQHSLALHPCLQRPYTLYPLAQWKCQPVVNSLCQPAFPGPTPQTHWPYTPTSTGLMLPHPPALCFHIHRPYTSHIHWPYTFHIHRLYASKSTSPILSKPLAGCSF